MNTKIINCLYSHFKNSPKKLQIVYDWDEVIQTLEPKVYYELSERERAYYDLSMMNAKRNQICRVI